MTEFRFHYIPYPLWRRRWPLPLTPLVKTLCRPFYPVDADENPPTTPRQMARFLARWRLLAEIDEAEARRGLEADPNAVALTRADAVPPDDGEALLRLPAQWEPIESVLLSWPVMYPPLWALHATLCEAIAPVAEVVIVVPRPTWASGIRLFLQQRGLVDLDRLHFLYLPTDDIWVRDYGPFVALNGDGSRVAVHGTYNPQPQYPQEADNAMPLRWAAHQGVAARALPLYAEGGNLLSDGAGTLITSDRFERRDPPLLLDKVQANLRRVFDFDKLIITPHLDEETTGHVDLLVKLADARTVLVTEPGESINLEKYIETIRLFEGESNARGEAYRVMQLPYLPPYFNWGVYPIWRTYTNSLTVNGRVLVPVYGAKADEQALAVYQNALPDYKIIPIDCRVVINGGGAVHCLTKEVPRA